ncbi:MAG: PEP motif-containing protein [Nitrosomonas europaea]|nr:hypothetical protein [Nitrosomonas europaea]KXK45689.1 MAG: PEP motif-containing protein [Nitrosomonas europaea]
MKNNNQLVYTGVSLAAMLAFGQVTQAAPLILGGNQTISTDTVVESVVIGNTGAGPTGGDGSLTVNSGAALINSGNGTFIGNIGGVNPQRGHGYIGLNAGSTGVATITGANSLWQNQNHIHVGFNGQGTLNIADGGKVTSTQGYLVTMPAPPVLLPLLALVHSGKLRVVYTLVSMARVRLTLRMAGRLVVPGISLAIMPVPLVALSLPALARSGKVLPVSVSTGAHLTSRMVGK